MGKGKLLKFEEMGTFPHVVQPAFGEYFDRDHSLKGKWNSEFFHALRPLVLELGCGKGEYTVGLASRYPGKNFLGVDIKGARIWRGAKTSLEKQMENVGFLRARIEFIESFFATGEVSEIWLTFPDPQLKKRRNKKRLTAPRFLNAYRNFIHPGGVIHLKTDNRVLYQYTLSLVRYNGMEPLSATANLYEDEKETEASSIQTHYEKMFLERGMNIHYLQFLADPGHPWEELSDDGIDEL